MLLEKLKSATSVKSQHHDLRRRLLQLNVIGGGEGVVSPTLKTVVRKKKLCTLIS